MYLAVLSRGLGIRKLALHIVTCGNLALVQVINENLVDLNHPRSRTQYSATTVEALEDVFRNEGVSSFNKLSNERVAELASALGESNTRVKKWFLNKVQRVQKPYKPVLKRKGYTGLTLAESQAEEAQRTGVAAPVTERVSFRKARKTVTQKRAGRKSRKTLKSGRQAERAELNKEELARGHLESKDLSIELLTATPQPDQVGKPVDLAPPPAKAQPAKRRKR